MTIPQPIEDDLSHHDAPSPLLRPDWLDGSVWPHPLGAIDHDGGSLAVTDVGTGPTLLFVHVGMWSMIWGQVIERLQDRFRCVSFDAPHNGLSRGARRAPSLGAAADAVDAVVCSLDLHDLTLVAHDLGAPAALHAAARWPDRIAGLAALNGFGWRPSGPAFRGMLALMGNPVVRELDGATGWLPRASATRFGAGRHWDRATRAAFRRGMGPRPRRAFHRYLASARRHDFATIEGVHRTLRDRPVLTVFGQRNDPLGFQPRWRERHPTATQVVVPKGYHFPMCDDPDLVATTLAHWHRDRVQPRIADHGRAPRRP